MKAMLLAVLDDIFFLAQIRDTAKRAGISTVNVNTREAALAKTSEGVIGAVIDLHCARAEPLELIAAFKARNIPTLGFLSHVQTELRAQAELAGCDIVVPRSAFSARLPQALAAWSTPPASPVS